MEVWALYAYGASNVLQEILTVKSDDTAGRVKSYEAIVKGENIPAAEIPESFKVLIKEMKSLCLNVQLDSHAEVTTEDEDMDDQEAADRAMYQAMAEDAQKTEEDDAASVLDNIAAELGELMNESVTTDVSELIGEGEER